MNELKDEGKKISRRKLLKWTAGAGAVAVLTGGVARACCYPQEPAWKGVVLSAREAWIFIAACEIILPEFEKETTHWKAVANIDNYLSALPQETVSQIHLMLNVVEHLTLAGGHLSRFTSLQPDERLEYLEFFRSKSGILRQVFRGLRDLCLLGYYQQETAWQRIGYNGPLVPASGIPAMERYESLKAATGVKPKSVVHSTAS